MKRSLILFVVFLLLAGLVGGFGYFHFVMKPEMIKGVLAGNVPPPTTVSAEQAKVESWRPELPAIGTFQAVQGIEIASEVDGIVTAIHFDSGQEIEVGKPLVELDDSVELSDLRAAEAQLKKANLDLERQQELLARGNTSQASFDAALSQRDTAAAVAARIRAVIDEKKIAAPFAGRLGIRMVSLGQYVKAGQSLVALQQLDPIFVDFPTPEQNVDRLRIGQTVQVKVDAFPRRTFEGKLASIDAKVNQETRTILVRAEIPNSDRALLPGMFANVTVVAGEPQEVVTLPRTAVSYSLYGDSVYIVTDAPPSEGSAGLSGEAPAAAPQVVERRFVRLGGTRDGRVAISEGVQLGDLVVTSGQIKLRPGAHVRVDPNAGLTAPAELPSQ